LLAAKNQIVNIQSPYMVENAHTVQHLLFFDSVLMIADDWKKYKRKDIQNA